MGRWRDRGMGRWKHFSTCLVRYLLRLRAVSVRPAGSQELVTPKSVTISRKADHWFISFKIDSAAINTEKSVDVVGVDLGIKSLATLSTGEVFEAAKSYRKLEAKLSRLQYLNRHKTKFSSNWKRASLKIAKLHSMQSQH
ncbi:transposase [Okeania sp. SIO2C9]|uniref:transposase n=1 Tax=Okeania sp. SIO2C9 TaxID=2607791 RepID=UPI0025F2EDA8|nr:transposase [Okeania sp. SIO2C9]